MKSGWHQIYLLAAIAKISGALSAQNLPVVGVPAFAFEDPVTLNLANQVTEFTLNLLKNSGKYALVDMTSEQQRKIALDRAQYNYKAENWLDQYASKNAEVIAAGEITSLKFVKSGLAAQPGYRAAVTLSLKLIRVESGEIMASSNFATKTSELRLTPETALSSSMESISSDIMAFFKQHIAQVFPIIKINSFKKQSVDRMTCEIPVILGYKPGRKFKVVWYENLNGKTIPQLIGEAQIIQHIAEDYWLLEVLKGGVEIFQHKDQLKELLCSE